MIQYESTINRHIKQGSFSEAVSFIYRDKNVNLNARDAYLGSVFKQFESCYEVYSRFMFLELIIDTEEGVFFLVNYLKFLMNSEKGKADDSWKLIDNISDFEFFLVSLARLRDSAFMNLALDHPEFQRSFNRRIDSQDLPSFISRVISSRHPQILENLLRRFEKLYTLRDENNEGIAELIVRDRSGVPLCNLIHRKEIFSRLCESSVIHPILFAARIGNLLAIKILLDNNVDFKDVCDDGMNTFQHWLVYSFNIERINFYTENQSSSQDLNSTALKILEYLLLAERVMPKIQFNLSGKGVCHYLVLNDLNSLQRFTALFPLFLNRRNIEMWCRRDSNGMSAIKMLLESLDFKARISFFTQLISCFAPDVNIWNKMIEHFKEPDIFRNILSLYSKRLLEPTYTRSANNTIMLQTVVLPLSNSVVMERDFFIEETTNWKSNKHLEDLLCNLYFCQLIDQITNKKCVGFLGFSPSFLNGARVDLRLVLQKLILLKPHDDSRGNYKYLENVFEKLNSTNPEILEALREIKKEHNNFKSKYYGFAAALSKILTEDKMSEMKGFAEITDDRFEIKEVNLYLIFRWLIASENIEILNKKLPNKEAFVNSIRELGGFLIPLEMTDAIKLLTHELRLSTTYSIIGCAK